MRRRVAHDAQETADGPVVVTDRAVGKGEVSLLQRAAAIEREHQVLLRERLAGVDTFEERLDGRPGFWETLLDAAPHGPRMLARPEDGTIRIVVEENVLRSPEDPHG